MYREQIHLWVLKIIEQMTEVTIYYSTGHLVIISDSQIAHKQKVKYCQISNTD